MIESLPDSGAERSYPCLAAALDLPKSTMAAYARNSCPHAGGSPNDGEHASLLGLRCYRSP